MATTRLAAEKAKLIRQSEKLLADRSFKKERKIVAEGDSWFDYPLVKDILDHLRRRGYAVRKCSKLGDTLENMVYGTDFKIDKKKHTVKNLGPQNLKEVKKTIRKFRPRFFLFSAGGNDVVGVELIRYLDHVSLNPSPFKKAEFDRMLKNYMQPTIENYLQEIWSVDPNLDILMDGYDYAKPNGKAYQLAGIKLAGPWILPGFGAKGITKRKDQDDIIKKLIDGFNNMLIAIDRKYAKFHHIDLRGMFPKDNEWHNEIHLKSAGYRLVTREYHIKIASILGYDPIRTN